MLQAKQLPTGVTDLDTGLTDVNNDDLTHGVVVAVCAAALPSSTTFHARRERTGAQTDKPGGVDDCRVTHTPDVTQTVHTRGGGTTQRCRLRVLVTIR